MIDKRTVRFPLGEAGARRRRDAGRQAGDDSIPRNRTAPFDFLGWNRRRHLTVSPSLAYSSTSGISFRWEPDMETPRPPDEKPLRTAAKGAVPTREQLDTLYRSVNGKFRDSAELRLEAGRELLGTLYGGDAALVLSPAGQTHPPWVAFRKLAGGRKVKPGLVALRRALRLAAFEKTVQGGFYANLDVALREELLPLSDADAIRAAAQHCIESNWGQRALRRHVEDLRRTQEQQREKSADEAAREATAGIVRFVGAHGTPERLREIEKACGRLSPEDRARALKAVEQAQAVLAQLRKALK